MERYWGNGSSRHGCESNEVKVLCRQLLGIGRLAYPMHMKATTCVLLGRKRHGCPVVEMAGGAPPEQAPGPQAYMAPRRRERTREPSTAAVGATGVASKLGGQNVRNDNGREKYPAQKSLSGRFCGSPTRSRFSGKADVVREETSKCTSRTAAVQVLASKERLADLTSGRAISQQGLTTTCKDPRYKAKAEVCGRCLVWRMSQYERRREGNSS